MRLLRSGIGAMVLYVIGASLASANETGTADTACDLACQMQVYLHTDHMMHLVPGSPSPVRPETIASRKKTKLAAPRIQRARPGVPTGAKIAAASMKPITKLAPAPAVTAQLFSPVEPGIGPRRLVAAPIPDPVIPGSAPRVTTTQFTEPVSR